LDDQVFAVRDIAAQGVDANDVANARDDAGEHGVFQKWLGPVNTKDASANVVMGAQSKAHGAAKATRLGETCNAALRPNRHVPEGLFPKRPCAALQSLAGGLPRLRFAPCSRPFEEQRIWHL
jgi:hypothetical protein